MHDINPEVKFEKLMSDGSLYPNKSHSHSIIWPNICKTNNMPVRLVSCVLCLVLISRYELANMLNNVVYVIYFRMCLH